MLWQCLPELLHVGSVLAIIALMIAVMGTGLFGDRAASFCTLTGEWISIIKDFLTQKRKHELCNHLYCSQHRLPKSGRAIAYLGAIILEGT